MERLVMMIYLLGNFATLIYLTFFDGYIYTAWNWIIVLPVNIMVASIWPIYWAVLHWIF